MFAKDLFFIKKKENILFLAQTTERQMTPIEKFISSVKHIEHIRSKDTDNRDNFVKYIVNVTKTFSKFVEPDRVVALEELSDELSNKLLSISGYMAATAIDRKSMEILKSGLILVSIENFRLDCRENIRYLVLLYQAAKQIGIDLKFVFGEIEKNITKESKNYMTDFMERDPSLNELRLFDIKQVFENGHTSFKIQPSQIFQKPKRINVK